MLNLVNVVDMANADKWQIIENMPKAKQDATKTKIPQEYQKQNQTKPPSKRSLKTPKHEGVS